MMKGRGGLIQQDCNLGTRGQVSLQDQMGPRGHLLARCKGHMKGAKVLDFQVRSTGLQTPALLLSMGTSSTGKRQEKGFREDI